MAAAATATKRTKGKAVVEKQAKALETLKIQYVPHDYVTPNSYNPNRQSSFEFALLLRSMREDGFTQPIVCVDNPDAPGRFRVVDGEHRWRGGLGMGLAQDQFDTLVTALEKETVALPIRAEQSGTGYNVLDSAGVQVATMAELPQIPICVVPMSEAQARIATLRHNRARGSEDVELSAQVLRDLQALGSLEWAQDSLMLDDAEVQALIEDIQAPEALAGEEYATAWEPRNTYDEETPEGREMGRSDGTQILTSMTPAAVEASRERERKLVEAKTEEEKAMIKADARIYRVSLVFQGDEADVIKAALGDQPAVNLLAICRTAQADKPAPTDAPAEPDAKPKRAKKAKE